jgi:hypothetical protein
MPIPVLDVPMPTFEQSNPWMQGMAQMQEIQNNQQLWKKIQAEAALQQAKAQYAPELAQADLQKTLADASLSNQMAQWFGPKAQSEIGLQGAQAGYAGAEADALKQSLPYKLAQMKFQQKYPLLSTPGAEMWGALQYASDNPDFNKALTQMQSGNPQDLTIQPQDYGKIAAGVNASGGQAQLAPTQDLGYTPANQGNVAQMLGLGGQPQPQQQQAIAPALGLGGSQQQPQNVRDLMLQSLFGKMAEQKAKTNYMTAMPGIRAAANPALLAAASQNEDAAKGILDTLMQQVSPGSHPTDQNVKDFQEYASDATLRKTKTANQINQMQYATNLDKLLAQGSELMPSVSQYAGVPGKLKLASDRAQASIGTVNPEYSDYLKFTRATVPMAAGEIGRTLGKQATNEMTKILTEVADPNYWDSNPDLAMQQWNWIVQTFQGIKGKGGINQALSASNTDIRKELASGGQQSQQQVGKVMVVSPDGKKGYIPASQVDEAMKSGYTMAR